MAMNWTDEQKKVISLRNRDILVSAAAGSGKTAVLVQRILEKVTDPAHPVDIDRMLVMTFTRAAAGEMKERIARALENALYEDPENEHLQKQMTLIHASRITTIDGFCSWILSNYFHLADLDPGYRMLEEGEAKLLRGDTAEELLNRKYEEETPGFTAFAEIFSAGKTDDALSNMILRLYDTAMSSPDPEEWLSSCEESYEADSLEAFERLPFIGEALKEISMSLESAEELALEAVRICLSPYGPWHYEEALQSDLEQIRMLRSRIPDGFDAVVQAFEGSAWQKLSGKRPKEVDEPKKEQVKALRDEVKEIVNSLRKEICFGTVEKHYAIYRLTRQSMKTLISLTREYRDLFAEKKKEKGVLDFSDLEHLALSVLRTKNKDGFWEPTEAARELSQKFDEVMIDEYQDSNSLQEEIASLVSGWAKEKRNTFMVGDVKQSIYRFRLARPELFMEKYRRFSEEDGPEQKVDLHRNFRSRRSVIDSVNYIFRQLMGEDLGGITYGEKEALFAGASYPEPETEGQFVTELLLAETDAPEPENEDEEASGEAENDQTDMDGSRNPVRDRRELEALMTAKRILELKKSGLVYDREKDIMRPASYGDMVILLRSFSGWAETFRDVLASQGIPVYVASRAGYFETAEIRTLLNYLRILDNPRQDIPLQGVLMSPLVHCTANELAVLRILHPKGLLWDSLQAFAERIPGPEKPGEMPGADHQDEIPGPDPGKRIAADVCTAEELDRLGDKLRKFLQLFDRHRSLVPYTPVHQLIRTILSDTGFDLYCGALPDGIKRSANLSMLAEKAREYEHTSYRGLFNFIRYIEQMKKYEVDFGEANVLGGGMDAVQIMTIHKSKGLEFPIVFVSGLGKRFNLQDVNETVLIHPDLGIGTKAFLPERRIRTETLQRRMIRRRIIQDNLGEELRVLYVALTRAKEKLIMTGAVSDLSGKTKKPEPFAGREQGILPYRTRIEARSYLDLLLPVLAGHRGMEDLFLLRCLSGKEIAAGVLENAAGQLQDAAVLRNWDTEKVYDAGIRRTIAERFAYVYPDRMLRNIPVKISVSELKKRSWHEDADLEETVFEEPAPVPLIPRFMTEEYMREAEPDDSGQPLQDTDAEEPVTGAFRGTACHRVMECLDYSHTETDEELEKQVEKMVGEERLMPEQASCVKIRDIRRFLDSGLGKRVKEAALCGRVMREQPFMIMRSARALDPSWQSDASVLVQGIIDLYFFEGEDIILVDYKTDRVRRGEEQKLIDLYHVQLEDYADALESLTGRKVREIYIYSFALGKEIPLSI